MFLSFVWALLALTAGVAGPLTNHWRVFTKADGLTEKSCISVTIGASGKILVVDPKWEFVVLSFGEEQGAKRDGELLVSRNGRLVAKVVIRGIEKDRCIANVMPGWTFGEVAEGDLVIPAHPES